MTRFHFPFHHARNRYTPSSIRPISPTMLYTDASKTIFTVSKVDTAAPPQDKGTIVFDVEVRLGAAGQRIFIGLLETASLGIREHSPGIGFSIDPTTGVIMDVVNDQGVIGYIEDENLIEGRVFNVKVEIEVLRQVCLPKITICGEIFLHPALYLGSPTRLSGLLGTAVSPEGRAGFGNACLAVRTSEEGLPA